VALFAYHLLILWPVEISMVCPWVTVTTRGRSSRRARSGHGHSRTQRWLSCACPGQAHCRLSRAWPWIISVVSVTCSIEAWGSRLPVPSSPPAPGRDKLGQLVVVGTPWKR